MQCYVQSTTDCSTLNELLSTLNPFYKTTHCSGKWIENNVWFSFVQCANWIKMPMFVIGEESPQTELNLSLAVLIWTRLFSQKGFCHQCLLVNLNNFLFEMFHYRHVVLTHSPSIRYNWYGGVVDAIFRAQKGLVSPEEVKKQIAIVAYGINSATHVLELDPII